MENMITVFENEEFGSVRTATIEDGRILVLSRTMWSEYLFGSRRTREGRTSRRIAE